jgi:hypothetical protein
MNKFWMVMFIFLTYTASQVFTFFQLQGHLFNKWIKDNPMMMNLLGIPIGYLVIMASRQMIILWNGHTWPNRLIGFSLGVVIFTFLSQILLKEPFTLKTGLCLFLCFIILMIQIAWK